MITIVYGDDIVSSRNYYIDERQKVDNPIILYGDNLNKTQLVEVFESDSLFEVSQKNVFIENFFSKKENKEIVSYIQTHSKKSNVLIWEGKEMSKAQISLFKNANIKLFSLPKMLFTFLNELKPGNNKKMVYLFHKCLEQLQCELIFFMMTRQFRLLLAVKERHSENQIEEIKRMVPWQKLRLSNQAKLFSWDNLKDIYQKIMNIDVSQKGGMNTLSLPQAIDFLLLSI